MQRPLPASIPATPGVYWYKDAQARIIYVGKARILRRRVMSYFRDDVPQKTAAMLRHAASIETLSTTTEKEALLLEASLIKKHRPHYNIVLRDDKQYVLFRLNARAPFPRLEVVRKARRDGARYFGPFTSALAARETWKLLHRVFGLRRCTDRAMRNRVRPCLYHHIGQCPAPCTALVTPEAYQERVRQVADLLSGRDAPLVAELERTMLAAAEALDFERAASLRDQLRAVRATVERQAAVLPKGGDMDVIGLHAGEKGLGLGIIFLRGGAMQDGRAFYWPALTLEDAAELLLSFVAQYYMDIPPPPKILLPWLPDGQASPVLPAADTPGANAAENTTAAAHPPKAAVPHTPEGSAGEYPAEIAEKKFLENAQASVTATAHPADADTPDTPADMAAQDDTDDISLLEQSLSEKRGGPVRLAAPRTPEENQLVDVASANAREEVRRRKENNIDEKLQAALHLPLPPRRIECVDVSHTGGRQTRVGMVVFEEGRPAKEQYRQYAMPDGDGDDYGTLAAWTVRRLESGPPWPDLLLIDGGRGQVAAVARALAEAGQDGLFPLAGIAKARDEQGHADRRAGNVADRIFLQGRSNPAPLRDGSPELLFLQHIRDCTHTFAIGGHRRARAGAALSGELMRLPGIGPATARMLWDAFGSTAAMRAATQEDLLRLPGIGKAKAAALQEKLAKLTG